MYQCTRTECGLGWEIDYDRCPICREYLIPTSMVKVQDRKGVVIMNAAEAKELTKLSQKETANRWWTEFSPKLIKAIENQCNCGHYELTIDKNNKELNDMNWVTYYNLFDKVKEEIEKLGYTFKHDTDDFNEWVNIKW